MSKPQEIKLMSVDEYLQFEESSDLRHEYVRGRVFVMTGATNAHNIICQQLGFPLQKVLHGGPCHLFYHNAKVWVKAADAFYYPDVVITCEPLKAEDVLLTDPLFIAEILSPSTKQTDRREKLTAYMQLPCLQYCLLVHHNRMLIEFYQRVSSEQWKLTSLRRADHLCLSVAGNELSIPVSTIYEGLDLPSVVQESEAEYELA